jgi:hypothetical protein
MRAGGESVSPAALLATRVAELLAMMDQPGLVTVADVETSPAGVTQYDLRLPTERPAANGRPALGEVVQAMTRVAEAVMQGKAVGLSLRADASGGAGRSEVAILGGLLRALVVRTELPAPPVLQGIVRRAVEGEAPDRYASVAEFRGDLLKLQHTIPAPSRGGTLELTRSAQLLAAMEIPDVVVAVGATPLSDGRIAYGLRQLLDGDVPARLGLLTAGDVVAVMARLSDALTQGRDAGMVLREVTSRGVTLPFAAGDPRAELTALGTILRDLLTASQGASTAPLTATIQRALDSEASEAFADLAQLRDELARQQQAARLLPPPARTLEVRQGTGQRFWWFVAVAVLLAFLALLIS